MKAAFTGARTGVELLSTRMRKAKPATTTARPKSEAKKALRQALKDRDDNFVPADKMTVGLYLDEWMVERKNTVSARTWRVQESIIRCRIKPRIGTDKLCKLSGRDVTKLYRRLLNQEGLSASTVGHTHVILKQALRDAVRDKYSRTNPIDDVQPPKRVRREKGVLTPGDVRKLLDAVGCGQGR